MTIQTGFTIMTWVDYRDRGFFVCAYFKFIVHGLFSPVLFTGNLENVTAKLLLENALSEFYQL